MLNKIKPKSEFSRNILTLMTGSTIAQAIPIAISPILTRIYTPEDFGLFALYMSISSLFSIIATGSYEHSIMLPKKDKDAINLVFLSILISIFISIFTLLIIFIFNENITRFLGNPEISGWLYFIPLTVLLTGTYQSFNYWHNRKKYYKKLSTNKIIQTGSSSAMNLTMGFSSLTNGGLILGSLFGQTISTYFLSRNSLNKEIKNVSKLKIIILAKKYINFLKFSTLSSLLNTISFSLFSILLSKIFNVSILGFYSLIYRILTVPSALIGSSYSQVYFQESTRQKNKFGNNKEIFLTTVKRLFIISSGIYLPMFFYIEDLVTFVFGQNWKISGEIAYILIPLMFIRFISSIMSSTLTTYEKQKSGLLINLILVTSVVIIFSITYFNKLDVYQFFNIYVLVMSIWYLLFLIYYYYLSKGEIYEEKNY